VVSDKVASADMSVKYTATYISHTIVSHDPK